ncbi:MAG TPA: hypothetical protein PK765_07435 [bacterium]|nr:hypothetical protein [bacterium]
MLVSNAILRSPEDIGHIRGSFGPDVFIFSLDGEIVPERRVSVMEDDTPNWLRS